MNCRLRSVPDFKFRKCTGTTYGLPAQPVVISNESLEVVRNCYLGDTISEAGGAEENIVARIKWLEKI